MSILGNPEPSLLLMKIIQGKQIHSDRSLEQYIKWLKELKELLDGSHKKLRPWIWTDHKLDQAYIAVPNYPSDYELKFQGPCEMKSIVWDVIRGYHTERVRRVRMYNDMNIPAENTLYELSDKEYQEIIDTICGK